MIHTPGRLFFNPPFFSENRLMFRIFKKNKFFYFRSCPDLGDDSFVLLVETTYIILKSFYQLSLLNPKLKIKQNFESKNKTSIFITKIRVTKYLSLIHIWEMKADMVKTLKKRDAG